MAEDEIFWRKIREITWLHLYLVSTEDICNKAKHSFPKMCLCINFQSCSSESAEF